MKHDIIKRAAEAVGGVNALARALGIKSPSIYSWKKIPPQRVSAVEAATGIPREELRPDLFARATPTTEDAR
ncbi:hypothetical protein GOB93_14165 [Acetobacter musti]|uniref:Helix-turn-helix domain-containing protein n=1 Tax=Acetobacter musti TaxID=864732 RepID=A0ABX0JQN6_9PROT|nr:hypothetical protein [Acetobacter musti]